MENVWHRSAQNKHNLMREFLTQRSVWGGGSHYNIPSQWKWGRVWAQNIKFAAQFGTKRAQFNEIIFYSKFELGGWCNVPTEINLTPVLRALYWTCMQSTRIKFNFYTFCEICLTLFETVLLSLFFSSSPLNRTSAESIFFILSRMFPW